MADLALHRLQQGFGFGEVLGSGRDPQLDLPRTRIGRHGGVGLLEQIRHLLGQGRFRDPPEAQHPAREHPSSQAGLAQPRGSGLLPHRLHLTGNPREGQHREARHRAPDHSGGRPGGIRQQLSPLRQERLAAIARRAGPAAGGQARLDLRPHLRVLDQGRLKRSSDRLGGEVIGGRAQAARGDQDAAAAGSLADLSHQALAVIADDHLALMRNAEGRQLLGNPAGIAVGDVAQQQFAADAEDFSRQRPGPGERARGSNCGDKPSPPQSRPRWPRSATGNATRLLRRPTPRQPATG